MKFPPMTKALEERAEAAARAVLTRLEHMRVKEVIERWMDQASGTITIRLAPRIEVKANGSLSKGTFVFADWADRRALNLSTKNLRDLECEHTLRWLAFGFVREWFDLGTAQINDPRPLLAHTDDELRGMLRGRFESLFVDDDENVAISTFLTDAYVYCRECRMEDAARDEIAARRTESHHETMARARARKARATTTAAEAEVGTQTSCAILRAGLR